MIFRRRFEHPKRKQDPVYVIWEPGYNRVRIQFRDEVIGTLDDPEQLIEGYHIQHDQLGDVKIELTKDPYELQLFFNGLHSPSNTNHPKVNIPSTAMNFIFPLILNFIIFIAVYENWDAEQGFGIYRELTILSLAGLLIYGASVILLLSNLIIGYLVGAAFVVIQAGLFTLSLTMYEWGEMIGGTGVMLILNIIPIAISSRAVLRYYRHEQALSEPEELEDILDEPFN